MNEEPKKEGVWKKPLTGKGVELAIGQYFLNRIGVLSLVVGIAFFIAYSFQFIGPWGKLLLGFAAAGSLLGLGKFLEKKPDMQWYGFGLIGGGWSLAYFTTYATHHIESVRVLADPHFALLALVLVTSLMMVDLLRYRSQSITTLTYLLAFFTAGIGKVTTFSLLYAALLALSMVLVIYKMKWNRLMIVAVLASYATHAYWLGPEIVLTFNHAGVIDGPLELSRLFLSAGFLTLYGILFAVAPMLVSCESEEDARIQTAVTVLNGFFYAVFMFQEVGRVNTDWRFVMALLLATFHVGMLYVAKYVVKRDHLTVSNMSLAISFITVSFPLRHVDRWVDIAWLAEIPLLVFLGLYFKRLIYRAFAWGLGIVMTMKLFAYYDPSHPVAQTLASGILSERAVLVWLGVLCFAAVQFGYAYFKKNGAAAEGEAGVGRTFYGLALYFLLCLSLFDMHPNFISISWALTAFLFFAAGFSARDRWFRYGALALVCLVVGRVALYDIRDLPTVYRIVLFIGLGLSLLAASFVYGRIAVSKDKEALQ